MEVPAHSVALEIALINEGRPPSEIRAHSSSHGLPWIPLVLELIRDAVRKDVPLLGHCLGGQLMSKAFGGTVGAANVSEPSTTARTSPVPRSGGFIL